MRYCDARVMSIVTCVTSGDRGFGEILTLSTGPCLMEVVACTADVTFGRSMTVAALTSR